ncbi:MAG: 30S ribosomal protein S3 [Nitrosospira sp.]|nr:30S ribosomal protein S3 [Nitrosospira sp.]MDW7643382.1 30S ribosomal protein S3 [Nitrosomonadaceae bacterium]MBI0408155.1 30S ribosomal protein S3 [Nitrosospira sp.]MBI0414639.1 30S ribosomal protein S3 [Nitrosospira sp.]MBI0416366.1 30S ribosomal protein S3 [Nitrosospira sp.]
MGQKIHPTGFRLSVLKNWSSRWYANTKNFPGMLHEDIKVREYLKKKLAHASLGRVIIERPSKNARITIYSSRPGIVIGKKGEDIEVLRGELQKRMGVPVHINIEEIRKPEIDAQLIADNIAQQLEKRIMFRRAMKRAMQNAMRLGAQGIKIMSAGRLNGIEIARTEWYREGRVPLHTLRADLDYGTSEAKTTYGVIGIKVWIFKGEVIGRDEQIVNSVESIDQMPNSVKEIEKKKPVKRLAIKNTKTIETTKPIKKTVTKTTVKPKITKTIKKVAKTTDKPVKPVSKTTTKKVVKSGAKDAATS